MCAVSSLRVRPRDLVLPCDARSSALGGDGYPGQMSTRQRIDVAMVKRDIVTSRAEAQEAIEMGLVTVGGRPVHKAATLVDPADAIHVAASAREFVSRGGRKLDAALSRSKISVTGKRCLDAGASTGGFTDRLLQGGASSVTAVDVGYGQLAWRLRSDDRVQVLERSDIRSLDLDQLGGPFDLVVADLSFISLRSVVPNLRDAVIVGGCFVFLVKPQFELQRGRVGKGGVVRDPVAWEEAITRVGLACETAGLQVHGIMASPLQGPAGNVEFLTWGAHTGGEILDAEVSLDAGAIATAVAEGIRLREAS